jgi:hypothetical protein
MATYDFVIHTVSLFRGKEGMRRSFQIVLVDVRPDILQTPSCGVTSVG